MRAAWINTVVRTMLPGEAHRWLERCIQRLKQWRRLRPVSLGGLRRLTPVSRVFGLDRGQCIDRYYIQRFLERHADDVRGHVLEIGDDAYTKKFGGECVTKSSVLHVWKDNPKATIVGDLASQKNEIPSDTFDCVICVQTLQFIYDARTAIRTLHRILKPGGVVLATFSGISQISRYDMDRWGEHWRFTTLSARTLFEEAFAASKISLESHGNVLAAISFLHGIAAEELRREELDYRDPDYEVLIAVRAQKIESKP